jgi:hypothetical protein
MKESTEDYSNKRIVEVITKIISWAISICIFCYFGFQSLYEKHYLFNTVQIMVLYGEYNSFIGYILWALDSISIWGFVVIYISLIIVSKVIEYFLKANLFNDNIVEKTWLGYLELRLKALETKKHLKDLREEDHTSEDLRFFNKWGFIIKLFPSFLTLGFFLICVAAFAIALMAIMILFTGDSSFVNMYKMPG